VKFTGLQTKVRMLSFCHGLAPICTEFLNAPSVRIRETLRRPFGTVQVSVAKNGLSDLLSELQKFTMSAKLQ